MWTVTTDKPVRLREGRSPDRLSRGVVAGYAAGSVGTGGFGVLPGLVLAYYLTDTLGVAAALASLVVIVPKIADVLIDPLIGSISDRSSHRTGTRVPLMLAGALGLPLLFILTFSAPVSAGPGVGAMWVLVFFLPRGECLQPLSGAVHRVADRVDRRLPRAHPVGIGSNCGVGPDNSGHRRRRTRAPRRCRGAEHAVIWSWRSGCRR